MRSLPSVDNKILIKLLKRNTVDAEVRVSI